MKKSLLTLLLGVLSSFAAFGQSGNSRNQAIPFDWEGVHYQKGQGSIVVAKWYDVDLTPVLDQSDPTLALYVTNMSETQVSHVTAQVFVGSSNTELGSYEFDLEPGQFRIMSRNVSIVKSMTYSSVYIFMQVSSTTDTVALSAKSVETKRIKDACKDSRQLYIDDTERVEANGSLRWFNFLMTGYKSGYDININVRNNTGAASTIETSLSYDCPSTGATDKKEVVPAGGVSTITIPVSVLEAIYEDRAYFSVKATGSYGISIEAVPNVIVPEPTIPDTTTYDWTNGYNTSTVDDYTWFAVACDSLTDDLLIPYVVLATDAAASHDVKAQLAYIRDNGGDKEFVILEDYDWSFEGKNSSFYLDVNVLMAMYSTLKGGRVYYGLKTPGYSLNMKFVLSSILMNVDCASASSLSFPDADLNLPDESKFSGWYTINVASWLGDGANAGKDMQITFTNQVDRPVTIYTAPVSCAQPEIDRNTLHKLVLTNYGVDGYTLRRTFLEGLADEYRFYIESDGYVVANQFAVSSQNFPASESSPASDAATTLFDWRYGHNQANDTVWYKILTDTLNDKIVSPQLYISNNGSTATTVQLQYAFQLPLPATGGKLQEPAVINLPAGADTLYTIPLGLIQNFRNDYFYLRVMNSSDELYIQMQLPSDNQYASRVCDAALDFNWVNGNMQVGDTTLWYKVDLARPKEDKSTIKLHIDNLGDANAHVTANIALSCPFNQYAETYNGTVAPGATRPAIGSTQGNLAYGMYSHLDYVWVRLKSDQKVHVWAELVPDEYNDTIWVCSEDSLGTTEFQFDHVYTITQDSTWFYFITDSLKNEAFAPLTWVPQITIKNPLGHNVNLHTITSFHCPITSTPTTASRSVGAGGQMVRTVERAMLDGYINKYDTIFFCVIAEGAADYGVTYEATMIDPNVGIDCMHAIDLKLCPDSNLQVGGEMWYRIDINSIRGKEITAKMENLSGRTQTINAAIYLSCESEVLEQTSRVAAAHTSIEREIGALVSGMRYSEAFLKITAEDSLSIKLCTGEDIPKGDSIHLCTDPNINLVKTEPNIWYHQEAGDTVYYFVDIAYLDTLMKENPYEDGMLRIKTDCGTVQLVANQWWECETDELPTTKGQTVTEEYNRKVTYEMIHAIQDSVSYVMVTGDKCFDFMLELNTKKGKTCDEAIEYDWDFCNTHPAGKWLWYHINVDTLLHNPDKDLALDIENLESFLVTAKVDSIKLSCGEKPIMEIGSRTLEAGEVKHQYVDNTLLQDFNIGNKGIYMKVWSDGQIRICPSLVDALQDSVVYDTIYQEVCYMYPFIDPFFAGNPDSVDVHNHSVTLGITENIVLSDTVGFRYDGTFHGDSIRYYEIHVVNSPAFAQPVDSAYLTSLKLEAGRKIDQTKRDEIIAELKDSIAAHNTELHEIIANLRDSMANVVIKRDSIIAILRDSIATIDFISDIDETEPITWKLGEWDEVEGKVVYNTPLSDDYTSPFAYNDYADHKLYMQVTYSDKCGTEVTDTLVLSFTPNTLHNAIEHVDTVCAGHSFTSTLSGITYVITHDTAVVDTVIYVDTDLAIKTDSVVTHTFRVFTHELSALEEADYPTMKAGMGLSKDAAETVLISNFALDNTYAPKVVSVTWTYSEDADKAADAYVAPETLSSTMTDSVWVAYKLLTDCSDELFDTIRIATSTADTLQNNIEAHICYGDSLAGRDGKFHVANVATQTWNDTIHNVLKGGVDNQKFDSVYVYTLTCLMPKDSTANFVLCEGYVDTTFFHTQIKDLAPGTYTINDTLRTAENCDSIWGVVNVTVNPSLTGVDSVYLCKGETYQWGTNTPYTWTTKGRYTDTQTFSSLVTGCDSVVTMTFVVFENDTVRMPRTICGGTAFNEYPFHNDPKTVGGRYEKVVKNNTVCDTVYVLDLTVQSATVTILNEALCIGETSQYTHISYSRAGNYCDTARLYYSVTGCDSMLTVRNITVYPDYHIDSVAEICQGESYIFNGIPRTATGNYVETRSTMNGCDSIITLHLTVNPTYEIPVTASICDNETYTWTGHKANIQYGGLSEGTYVYYDSLRTVKGCDSVYVLTLTVYPTYQHEKNDTICRGDIVDLGQSGRTPISQSGDYVERRTSVHGCDSIITHHVVVRSTPTLPDAATFHFEPRVVCGMRIEFPEIDEAIVQYFEDALTTNPQWEQYDSHRWQMYMPATNTWDDLGSVNEFKYQKNETFNMRYVVTTKCGQEIYSQMFSITVEPRSTENNYASLYLNVVNKYDGWLLLLDVKDAMTQISSYPDPDVRNIDLMDVNKREIRWYQMLGATPASINPSTGFPIEYPAAGGDLLLSKADPTHNSTVNSSVDADFYRVDNVNGRFAPGYYYAVLKAELPTVSPDSCNEVIIRTDIAEVTPNGAISPSANGNNAPSEGAANSANGSHNWRFFKTPVLTPSVVTPGTSINVVNINPDVVTTVEVYDVMGERLDTFQLTGENNFTYPAPLHYGCFLMNIRSEEGTAALKFIVR